MLKTDKVVAIAVPDQCQACRRELRSHNVSHSSKVDDTNVHQDVAMLESAELLLRDGRKLTAPWDALQASVSLTAES